MNRCKRLFFPFMLVALAVAVDASAQGSVREFPRTALRGVLQVLTPPAVLLDGQADRLSPGARIHGPTNMLVMSGAIAGERLVVNFTRNPQGLIHEVWLLTPTEAALARETATPARNFNFESEANRPPRDDGKTPYHLLPGYRQQ